MAENLLAWPEASYLVNHEYKFVYCPIMRVASTNLKKCCLKIAGINYTDETWANADVELRLKITDPNEAYRILRGNEYFKFAFVRNPFSRLVSAYLAAFVQNYKSALSRKTILDVKKRLNLPNIDEEKRITFRHFVQYIAIVNELDAHWLPQTLFLGDYTNFDFLGRFENLPSDLEYINSRIGPVFDTEKKGSVGYANKADIDSGDNYPYYDNRYGDELLEIKNTLGGYPPYKRFYPRDLKELVVLRYLEDIKQFKYEF